jgi:hypothetical protein
VQECPPGDRQRDAGHLLPKSRPQQRARGPDRGGELNGRHREERAPARHTDLAQQHVVGDLLRDLVNDDGRRGDHAQAGRDHERRGDRATVGGVVKGIRAEQDRPEVPAAALLRVAPPPQRPLEKDHDRQAAEDGPADRRNGQRGESPGQDVEERRPEQHPGREGDHRLAGPFEPALGNGGGHQRRAAVEHDRAEHPEPGQRRDGGPHRAARLSSAAWKNPTS